MFTAGFADIEWQTDEVRESRFVFIGKNLDTNLYRQGFQACSCAAPPLRFQVGDLVQTNASFVVAVGGGGNTTSTTTSSSYQMGKVLKQLDDGNAYRIEIQNDTKTNVYVPIDVDVYVRAC